MRRRRVWCEFLPPDELGSAATIELLARFGLEPTIALPPRAETNELAIALKKLQDAGVPFGLWPLLDDGDGYWPSEHNAATFAGRVDAALTFAARAGARPATIAIDLEPPLQQMRALMEGGWDRAQTMFAEGKKALAPQQRALRREAIAELSRVSLRLEALGIESLVAALPPVLFDLASGFGAIQAFFGTPVFGPSFAVISPMLYTTIIADLLPAGDLRQARSLLYEGGRILVAGLGAAKASMSLGLVTTGKLSSEPAYGDPEALALDVAAARAAGVDDLALYALEGVLHRGHPERWLVPYTETEGKVPESSVVGWGTRLMANGLGLARRRV